MIRESGRAMNRSALVLGLLSSAACSTVRIVPQPLSGADAASITRELEERAVSIKLRDEARSTAATDVVVTPAAVEWRDLYASDAAPRMRVPTAAVERITMRNHARGAIEGMSIGLGFGLAGLLAGAISGGEYGAVVGIRVLEVGVGGALILAVIGGVFGHRHSIELATSPPP